ncbi:MAG: methionine biosynthesis protein MetW [bacterium]|jgi:methionine biosynthesis protein MetW
MPSDAQTSTFPLEYTIIESIVEDHSRVLDLGCGEGDLLKILQDRKHVLGTGVEVSEEKVYRCIQKGLSVHHFDIDQGLADFPDGSFEYVILSETLQEVRRPMVVIQEMLRVGQKCIVTFPNFAYWKIRLNLLVNGKAPITSKLPYRWYESPNIQFLSISDFIDFCEEKEITICTSVYYTKDRKINLFPNLLAESALFVIT